MRCNFCNKEFSDVKDYAYHLIDEANAKEKAEKEKEAEIKKKKLADREVKIKNLYEAIKKEINEYNKESDDTKYKIALDIERNDTVKITVNSKPVSSSNKSLTELINDIFNM